MLLKNMCFFQAGIGILANAFLLLFHIFTIYHTHRPKPTDVTICHLAFVHIVLLLSTPDILSADKFKSLNFPNNVKCKALFYMIRLMRGLSICTTCLLSIIHVIFISPSTSCMIRFKQKLTNYTIHAFFCFWSLNLSSKSSMIMYSVAHSNMTHLLHASKYCSLSSINSIIREIFFILTLLQDIFFVGIMLLCSAYMAIFLANNHQRRSEYLHSMSILPRISLAKRATHTVLLLVSFFVIVYCVDIIMSSFSTILWKYDTAVLGVQRLVGNVYTTVSPFVLIRADKRIIGILQNMIVMTSILSSQ
nr:putative vomeronasal receptor-like protein 4 [Oryctolagus cuniculus]